MNPSSDATPTARPTVLYVDDEALAGKYFARAVGAEYDVLLATSCDEAIAVLHDNAQVAVLLTDFRMPGRDGGELLEAVAHDYPRIVRILVTAYTDIDVLQEKLKSGAVFRILEKPLRPASVRDTLQLAFERYHESPPIQGQTHRSC
ncbi:response regulator [Paraburkholderia acidisoli]|uniref:Response regulator n=1 Tax=Paraburkholderia acidisoli TaxID=2571748 RepID=A0A7Z2GPZ5_9BURK|nr:response regulator [Paraburkholderia acidisoli]